MYDIATDTVGDPYLERDQPHTLRTFHRLHCNAFTFVALLYEIDVRISWDFKLSLEMVRFKQLIWEQFGSLINKKHLGIVLKKL